MKKSLFAVGSFLMIFWSFAASAQTDEQDFVAAACRGDTKLVSLYTRLPGLNVNFISDGETALTCAARNMKWETLAAMLGASQLKYDLTLRTGRGDQLLHLLRYTPDEVLRLVANVNRPNQFNFFAENEAGKTIFELEGSSDFSIGKIADLNEVDPNQLRNGRNLLEEAVYLGAGNSGADLARTGKFDLMKESSVKDRPLLAFVIGKCAWDTYATLGVGLVEGAKKQGLGRDFFAWSSSKDSGVTLFSLIPAAPAQPCGQVVRALLSNYPYSPEYLQPKTSTDIPLCEKFIGDEELLKVIDKLGGSSPVCKEELKGRIGLTRTSDKFRCEDLKGNSSDAYKDYVTGYIGTSSSSGGECDAYGICYEAYLRDTKSHEFEDREPGTSALKVIDIRSSQGKVWKIPYWSKEPNEFAHASVLQLSVSPEGRVFFLLSFVSSRNERDLGAKNDVEVRIYEFSTMTGRLSFLRTIDNRSGNVFSAFAASGGLIYFNKPGNSKATYVSNADGSKNMSIKQIELPVFHSGFHPTYGNAAAYVRLRKAESGARLAYMTQEIKSSISDCRYQKQEWVYDAAPIVEKMGY